MHFKDDSISDMHAKNYLIILCLKHFSGRTKFCPVFWSRLFRRGPVEYNYPLGVTLVIMPNVPNKTFACITLMQNKNWQITRPYYRAKDTMLRS